MDDEVFTIPCEFCDTDVPAFEYVSHVQSCPARFATLIEFVDQEEGGVYRINIPNMIIQMIRSMSTSNLVSPTGSNVLASLVYVAPEVVDMTEQDFNMLVSERLGTVRVGVGDIAKVTTEVGLDTLCDDDVCAICREIMVERKPEKLLQTWCHHTFCGECLTEWLSMSKRCPLCMNDLTQNVPEKN